MGQEISQQRAACKNISRRQKQQQYKEQWQGYEEALEQIKTGEKKQQHYFKYIKQKKFPKGKKDEEKEDEEVAEEEAEEDYIDQSLNYEKYTKYPIDYVNSKYRKYKEPIYTSSSISNASSTDDEYYKHYQKYNLAKQSYEKSRIVKQLSLSKLLEDSSSSSSDYQSFDINSDISVGLDINNHNQRQYDPNNFYRNVKGKHQRNQSLQSATTDSGIYYSSCDSNITPTPNNYSLSTRASIASGSRISLESNKSKKSLLKQKEYLNHHLYIKSYLDILEEDEKARALYQIAKPGGIRNYTPKILSEPYLSTGSGVRNEDPWI